MGTGEEKRTGGFIRVRIISPPGSLANSAEKATISPLYKSLKGIEEREKCVEIFEIEKFCH